MVLLLTENRTTFSARLPGNSTVSVSGQMRTSALFHFLVIVFSVGPFTAASAQQQVARLHSVGTIVDGGPYSFPEKVTLDRFGNLYILDSELSNIFVVRMSRSGAAD